jgi:hypothetical protein
MAFRRRGDHWLWVGGPVPPGSAAITIGPVICVRRRFAGDEPLLRHEDVHVGQWRTHGVVAFVVRYVGAYLRWRVRGYPHWGAYRRIPLEIEADWRARSSAPAAELAAPVRRRRLGRR